MTIDTPATYVETEVDRFVGFDALLEQRFRQRQRDRSVRRAACDLRHQLFGAVLTPQGSRRRKPLILPFLNSSLSFETTSKIDVRTDLRFLCPHEAARGACVPARR